MNSPAHHLKHGRLSFLLMVFVLFAISLFPVSPAFATSGDISKVGVTSTSCVPGASIYVYATVNIDYANEHPLEYAVINTRTGTRTSERFVIGGPTDYDPVYPASIGRPATVPSGTQNGDTLQFRARLFTSSGTLIDAMSYRYNCATGKPPGVTNLLLNSSFEQGYTYGGVRLPLYWYGTNHWPDDGQTCWSAHTGSCSLRFRSNTGPRAEYDQWVSVHGVAGDTYSFSLWTRSSNAGSSGTYRVRTMFAYADGTYGSFTYVMPGGTRDWTRFARTISATKEYNSIRVTVMYGEPAGTVWYDDVRLDRVTAP